MLRFYLDTWQDVLMAADLISMTDTSLDIGPTRHGLTQGQTIYFFDPSGNRNEVFAGGGYRYQDHPVITWDAQSWAKPFSITDRQLNERFLSVLTLNVFRRPESLSGRLKITFYSGNQPCKNSNILSTACISARKAAKLLKTAAPWTTA